MTFLEHCLALSTGAKRCVEVRQLNYKMLEPSALGLELDEVLQQLQADSLAFFRVKLGCEYIVSPDG